LYGREHVIVKDHIPLKYLRNIKETNSRLVHWQDQIREMQFREIQYKKGSANVVADALSRIPIEEKAKREVRVHNVGVLGTSSKQKRISSILSGSESDSEDDSEIESDSDENESGNEIQKDTEQDSGTSADDVEFDEARRLAIFEESHDKPMGGHRGYKATMEKVRKFGKWKGLAKQLKEYIRKCDKCQRNKVQKLAKHSMMITDTPVEAMEKVCLDCVGPLPESAKGNKYLLTFQCNFSKFVGAIPVKNIEAETVARKFVNHVVFNYGLPKTILTDQGSNFTSQLFKNMCRIFNVKKIQTTAYRPQSNGGLERFHRTLKEYLRNFIKSDQSDWDEQARIACFVYNTSKNEGTGYLPFELMQGREVDVPSALKEPAKPFYAYGDYVLELKEKMRRVNEKTRENLIKRKEISKKHYDRNTKDKKFRVGDKVKLRAENVRRGRSQKIDAQYLGPYEVLEVLSDTNVRIKMGRKELVVHVDRVENYY
jgi:transposase InsO family protein